MAGANPPQWAEMAALQQAPLGRQPFSCRERLGGRGALGGAWEQRLATNRTRCSSKKPHPATLRLPGWRPDWLQDGGKN